MKAATALPDFVAVLSEISIHAAREGGDLSAVLMQSDISPFQSTPPVKAATLFEPLVLRIYKISIHAAREGGDNVNSPFTIIARISIHAAREGGDVYDRRIVCGFIRFQSTPPVKAATTWRTATASPFAISIHAAREGGDAEIDAKVENAQNFNPRRP